MSSLHFSFSLCGLKYLILLQKAEKQAKSRLEKPPTDAAAEELREEEKDEDEQLLQEFEEEVADVSVPSEKIEEIKEEMQKEFDNIINEVERQKTACPTFFLDRFSL